MAVEIKVPTLGESVTEATVSKWLKARGAAVKVDEPLVELETDKVSVEVNAPASGVLDEVLVEEGADVAVGTLLGRIAEGAEAAAAPAAAKAPDLAQRPEEKVQGEGSGPPSVESAAANAELAGGGAAKAGPAARKIAGEKAVDLASVTPTGPKGNVTKGDVLAAPARPAAVAPAPAAAPPAGREERVRMTRLRKRIAERLKEAQNTAAMLTTFNEVDMGAVMGLRSRYQDSFTKKHGVKLGFMSFFVKACIEALKAYPAVNAEIDGDEVVYKHYYDIGVAVSTDTGLLVPVLRDAEAMGLADIEKAIGDLGKRAREGKLAMEELTGGTFSITNGGIFGSLMSTPILNPPQSGILGMHKIQDRPMVVGGKVEVRPMMYLALSYDHRIIDGREAVSFLVRVKECIEAPERILLDA
ncbi:MAG TPA: 2-oxoglutarate dehydrogenase complex dihydrolipoyllysine-residue succinyltransferase [Geminicoccaceae bacterium]|nr:2-oxoglutarate dehydrogenase complex dihydrolipoyllysine-residue succinyltransferase [Geminicoccaceae bacterium]